MNRRHTGTLDFAFVLFGGTEGLATRKVLPALFAAHRDDELAARCRIIVVVDSVNIKTRYRELIADSVMTNVHGNVNDSTWASFIERINYIEGDLSGDLVITRLADQLRQCKGGAVLCLATEPSLIRRTCRLLASSGLVDDARLICEQPACGEWTSSVDIHDDVGPSFGEDNFFCFERYLGRGLVQNLLALRFGTSMSPSLWHRDWIESVRITVADGGDFGTPSNSGDACALRHVIQSRVLPLLSLIAMEPPQSLEAHAVGAERLRVLRALSVHKAVSDIPSRASSRSERETARADSVFGHDCESDLAHADELESVAALMLEISNARWSGVPFVLSASRGFKREGAEIVVNFRGLAHPGLPNLTPNTSPHQLKIVLDERGAISMDAPATCRGFSLLPQAVNWQESSDVTRQSDEIAAYRQFLLDVLSERRALFTNQAEHDSAARWTELFLANLSKRRVASISSSRTRGPASTKPIDRPQKYSPA
jgi:glucose-6-phosphate 1-dehydrogenase